jgi:hypothetical protein
MLRIVRTRTLADLENAVFALRDLVVVLDPEGVSVCAGHGCCGCGRWAADVVTPARETYCWACVTRLGITAYVEMDAYVAMDTDGQVPR